MKMAHWFYSMINYKPIHFHNVDIKTVVQCIELLFLLLNYINS